MYARGLSVREIQGHLEEIYGLDVSLGLISTVTDAVMEAVSEWQHRSLERCYPLVFFDAIHVKIRNEGFVRNKAIYVALGFLMDGLSVIFVTIPIVFPLVQSLGIDPVLFGILVVTATEIGLITPPVGMNLFVIKGIEKGLKIVTIWRGVIPFIAADLVRLALLIAFPIITLLLPGAVR